MLRIVVTVEWLYSDQCNAFESHEDVAFMRNNYSARMRVVEEGIIVGIRLTVTVINA